MALFTSALLFSPAETPAVQAQCSFTPGAVVQLVGTPHLFIVDESGVLHWGGDTRALAGRYIDWSRHCDLSLDALRATRRGDPWLSSGLPKIGDPIYLSKWEDTEATPRLLHIQSITDVELFGINAANYLNFVLDRATWQQRYGFDVGLLQVGPLASAESYAYPEADRVSYALLLTNLENLESVVLFRARTGGIDPATILPFIADCEHQSLADFERSRNASTALALAQDCLGRLGTSNPTPSTGTPRPPTNVRLLALGTGTLRLSWDDVSNETGFRIYGGDQTVPANTFVTTLGANTTSYDIGGRVPGVTYCYSVSAYNASGESAANGPVCGTTSGTTTGAPTAPTNLRVTFQGNTNRLDWTDASNNEDGFRIMRGGQIITTVGANTTTFTDGGIVPGPSGCYTVVAYNTFGQASSEQVCAGSFGGGAPTAPTGLILTSLGGGNAIRLDWTDTSSNEDGFRVFRGSAHVATLGPNSVTFTDGGIVPGSGQCYTVAAFNGAGQSAGAQTCLPAG
jgi:hypothetical protein